MKLENIQAETVISIHAGMNEDEKQAKKIRMPAQLLNILEINHKEWASGN